MISEARRRASRINGRASRGPKTLAGKARSARNAHRHGLSRSASLDPARANDIAALARAIAGAGAGMERFGLACRIAAAAIDVVRVRRARCELLATVPLDDAAIARAAALDRYERRALSCRKAAIRAFYAAVTDAGAGLQTASACGAARPMLDDLAERTQLETRQGKQEGGPAPDKHARARPSAAGPVHRMPSWLNEPGALRLWRRELAKRTRHARIGSRHSGRTNPRMRLHPRHHPPWRGTVEPRLGSFSRSTSAAIRCASFAAGMPQYIATSSRMS